MLTMLPVSQSKGISLPSIHEMFPEHLNHHSRVRSPPMDPRSNKSSPPLRTADPLHYSFNVLRSDPSNSSLEHIASSPSYPHKSSPPPPPPPPPPGNLYGAVPPHRQRSLGGEVSPHHVYERNRRGSDSSYTTISFPLGEPRGPGDNRPGSSDVNGSLSDDGDAPSSGGVAGKKHICPTCSKRFNRPSSLRIHVNTHTGATPFRCPWPNCGREFNVNSNMRRHYRNHTSPGLSRTQAQPAEPRRRRRRAVQDLDLVFVSADGSATHPRHNNNNPHPSFLSATPESGVSDDSDDEQIPHPSSAYHHFHDDYHHHHHRHAQFQQHARESHLRASTPMSVSSSGSPPATPASEHKYSPSAPYLRSVVTDTSVSTALRPAFTNGRT